MKGAGKSAVREIAACAVMVALLLAVQLALGFVSGVELVTVLLLAFCYAFGVRAGVLTATAFSLVRCLIFGFFPNVVVLYLTYYNLFALLFGFLGAKERLPAVWVCPVMLALLAAACGYFAGAGLKVSVLYREKITAMLWVLFGLLCALLAFYFALLFFRRGAGTAGRELASVTALAALCTVCFTLLDDLITPLFLGYSFDGAIAYFYTGFFAMIPQTICAVVSVFLLFCPLKKIFFAAAKRA